MRIGVLALQGAFIEHEKILEKIDEYVVYPGLGDEAGFVGSIALGKLALNAK